MTEFLAFVSEGEAHVVLFTLAHTLDHKRLEAVFTSPAWDWVDAVSVDCADDLAAILPK